MYVCRETANGILVINPRDRFLGRCLESHRIFSPEEVFALCTGLDRNSVVIEVGANIGALTVPLARVAGRVVAYEPQRLIFQMLCANLVLNGLLNVDARQQAVGIVGGVINVPVQHPETDVSFGSLELNYESPDGELVDVVALDDVHLLGEGVAHERCDLIKVDVEGMEAQVLRGAAGLIRTYKPRLYIENDRPEKSGELIDLILRHGYRAFWHMPVLAPDAASEFGHTVSLNMLCIHSTQPVPHWVLASKLEEITSSSQSRPMFIEERRVA